VCDRGCQQGGLGAESTDRTADIIAVLTSLGMSFGRIGIEAGPLSQWLVNELMAAELPVICVETQHMKALLTAQQIRKRTETMRAGSHR
jgi:transposase